TGNKWGPRPAERSPVSLDEVGRRIKGNQQRQDSLHHYFCQRHGHRGPRAAPSGTAVAGREKRRASGGISSGGDTRSRFAGRSQAAAPVRASGSGEGGGNHPRAVFRARGKERTSALAVRRAVAAP